MHIGSKLVKAGDLGLGGFLYGGRLLEYLAEQSAIYAMKSTGEPHLLGYRFDNVVIANPAREGDILDFTGGEPHIGRTSVSFDLTVKTGDKTILTARCVFVAVGPDDKKKVIGGGGGERKKF